MRYRESDEVRAPRVIPEIGVRAGDPGVVTVAFDRPRPAIEVMFSDAEGEPGPCVVYSPDLSEVYSHHPGYNA